MPDQYKVVTAYGYAPKCHFAFGENEWDPLNRFNPATAVVTPTDCPKLLRNRCVIEDFGDDFVLSRRFF